MKKLLFIFIILCLSINGICADEYTDQGTYSIELSCTNLPSYSVKIPKSLDISNNETTLNYFVKGDIYGDQTLNVLFDSSTTLTNSTKQATVQVAQDKSSYSYSELSEQYVQYMVTLSHENLSAGIWQGSLNVMISLQEEN